MYHRRLSEEVEAALSALDASDAAVAADARVVWSELLECSAREWPTQASIQQYCWRILREQYASTERRWEMALVLAQLLDRLCQPRYAEIARGDITRTLLFAEGAGRWWSLYRDALDQAGVQPADTDLITWHEHPRRDEHRIAQRIADTLEVVAVVGDLSLIGLNRMSPAARRRRMTDAVLVTEDAMGRALIDRIVDERLAQWSGESVARARLCGGLGALVQASDQLLIDGTRRMRGLLDVVGDGVSLNNVGDLRDPTVAEVVNLVWPGQFEHLAARETDIKPVLTLRRLVMRLRLLRKHRGSLVPTVRARGLTDDGLTRLLIANLIRDDAGIGAAIGDVVLCRIARDGDPGDARSIAVAARELLQAGVRPDDTRTTASAGRVLPDETEGAELPAVRALLAELTVLGALDDDGAVTEDGTALAGAVLRHRLLHVDIGS